jgi:hypothetical protein
MFCDAQKWQQAQWEHLGGGETSDFRPQTSDSEGNPPGKPPSLGCGPV